MTWLSPAFPVGSFSYSHGIEYAVEAGLVGDADTLCAWIGDVMRFGAGRNDAILLGCAWRAEIAHDDARLAEVLAWADAFRGTAELALESAAQGRAFLAAVRAAWPHPRLAARASHPQPPSLRAEGEVIHFREARTAPGSGSPHPPARARDDEREERPLDEGRKSRPPVYPVAVGVACAVAGIGEATARLAFLHAFAANLVSAGVRLIPLGQSDGLRVLAALEPVVREVADEAAGLDLADLGTAAWMADWCSARHETQYTRLFRS